MPDSMDLPQDDLGTLHPGARLGQYEIVRLLGSGGMGAVYEAVHTTIGKHVAAKVLSPAIATIPGAQARFLREAQLTSRVRHPHIVDVTDMGSDGSRTYIVMELLRGEDLAHRLSREGQLSPADIADIMLPVCSAMVAAHDAGITHRDLKPSNVFLADTPQGIQPKVLDFGISKGEDVAFGPETLTGQGAVVGTPFYLSPEQIVDNRSAGPASDQYALGVILYECVTGTRPFQADNLYATFQAIVAGFPTPPHVHRPDLTQGFEEVVLKAMSVDPNSRFGSARDLGRALCGFASARSRLLWEDAFGSAADDFGRPFGSTPPPRSVAVTQILQAGSTPPGATPRSPMARGPGSGGDNVGRAGGTRILTPVPPRMFQMNAAATPAPVDYGAPRSWVARRGAIVGAAVGLAILIGVWLAFLRPTGSSSDARDTDGASSHHPRSIAQPIADPSDSPETPPPAPSPQAVATATAAAASTAAPATSDTFRVALTVDPEAALIELDGKVAGRGTLRRSFPIDHERHVLHVSADGFDPKDVEFTDAPPTDEHIELSTRVTDAAGGGAKPGLRPHHIKRARHGGPTLNPNGAPIID